MVGESKKVKDSEVERCKKIMSILTRLYPNARCTLDFSNPLELLVATILAAQCTDERVNVVTKSLFKKYRNAKDYVDVEITELENDIRTCGFYRNKARCIKSACEKLIRHFGGEVPKDMDDLLQLDGVGRKTANVILTECFGKPGIIVDTHCSRLAKRLGFTQHDDPNKIEEDLQHLWPKKEWGRYSHVLVFHGRNICLARKPKCIKCAVKDLCPYPEKVLE